MDKEMKEAKGFKHFVTITLAGKPEPEEMGKCPKCGQELPKKTKKG